MFKILSLLLLIACFDRSAIALDHPNIVLIYADDLGYGDVSCYNSDSKIPTPNIDKLAAQGIRFVDAHAPDTVCSPSRYGILTGRYSWRTGHRKGNPKIGAQPWINTNRIAIAKMLQQVGYDAAVIGKWGLGTDWNSAAKPERKGLNLSPESIDYSKPIYSARPFGFSYEAVHLWYGTSYFTKKYPREATPDAGFSTDGGRWYFDDGVSRGGDPDFASFDMEDAQMYYIQHSVDYILAKGDRKNSPKFNQRKDAPFFLYYAPHIPHYPHVPAPQFQGSTKLGHYGDFIAELDWAVAQIVQALKQTDQLKNTILIFTSDNGPERQSYKYHEKGHASSGAWRGVKRDLWEGGHRTPFIISWPEKIAGGQISDRLISQTDIYATIAELLKQPIPNDAAEDSYSFLNELLPESSNSPRRELAIHHSGNSDKLALRQGDWVFVNAPSGANKNAGPKWLQQKRGVKAHQNAFELFNLKDDPQQTTNRASEFPEKVEQMKLLLEQLISSGRSAPSRKNIGEQIDSANVNPSQLISEDTLNNFKPTEKWSTVQSVSTQPEASKLLSNGDGKILLNSNAKDRSIPYLFTRDEFADVSVSLEFMIPKGSNAGLYLMGRYEVQIFDSYGKDTPEHSDLGGIYQRWRPKPIKGKKRGYEGVPPTVNAAKAPGEWQQMQVTFRAPRFNANGEKIANARFESVHVNERLVQSNVPVSGPTRAHPLAGESPRGPIAIQGDHGPIAIRSFVVTPL